ncbi:MAG: hypothetical protein JNL62_15830 [Bryobacterales bacterium]|nr:hypothetical protein [Bryobacterales bacterium]
MSRGPTDGSAVDTRFDISGRGGAARIASISAWLGKAARYCVAAGLAALAAMAEQLPATVFSLRQGPSSIVLWVLADRRGFVWLPAEDGLTRFDGGGFRTFTSSDGLPGGMPEDMIERTDGTYWVAVHDQLCLLNPHPGQPRFRCESPKLGVISRLLEDEQGLWCGTESGLWRLTPTGRARWEAVKPLDPNGTRNAIHRMLKDSRGELWVTAASGLYRFRRDQRVDHWSTAEGITVDKSTALSETEGSIWTGSQTELFRLTVDPRTSEARIASRATIADGLPSGYVADVRSWRGELWAATFQGLARLLPDGRWQAVELHPNLNTTPLGALTVDTAGHLWVGTDGGGAARISPAGFAHFNERDGLAIRKVWAIVEDDQGGLMVVTKDERNYSISRFDGYRFHIVPMSASTRVEWGWSWSHIAVRSRTGQWWLGTGAGVLRYPRGLTAPPVRIGRESGLPPGNMRVFEDSRGVIWVGQHGVPGHALFRLEPGAARFESLGGSDGLAPLTEQRNSPIAFAEDRGGNVWIGMRDGGLVRFRDGKFQQFPPSTGAPDQGVRALLVDGQGRLWIGSRMQGLLRVNTPDATNPVFHSYTMATGLSANGVSALAEDRSGRIYLAGRSGIDRLDPATGRVRRFDTADGLTPGEFRVAARDRHGAIWFGGDQGLVRLQPRDDPPDPSRLVIYSVRANGRDRLPSDFGDPQPAALSLDVSERRIQVEFGGFRHDLLYQTLLSGVDTDWTPPSASRTVDYASLGPGRYVLSVRAISPEGRMSPEAKVEFLIAPPFWRRWWFLLAVCAGAGTLLFLWHRARLDRHVAIERVRSRIATDLHDDIGASLSRIAMMSEVLKCHEGGDHPVPAGALGEIAETARGLIDDMSDIVWAIDPRRDTLRDLAARLRAFGFAVLEPCGIRWTFEPPDEALSRTLSPGQRRQLYLILKEAIHNIARHSRASHASLRIGFDRRGLWSDLEDDGCGYRPGGPKGMGILSMHARAAQLGGRLEVEPRPEGGTRVLLRIPLGKDA